MAGKMNKQTNNSIRHLDNPLERTGESNFNYSWQQEAKTIINQTEDTKN